MRTQDALRVLDEAGVDYDLLPHERTDTAADEAAALGLPPEDVAKTLVISVPEGYARVVVPASCRVDMHKLREALGGSKDAVKLASEEDMKRDYPEFELGAVPPVGGSRAGADAVVIDTRVAARDAIVVEAGSHSESVRLKASDLIRIADAQVADVCKD